MIRSMTGYGEASCQADGAHYFVEIRSLNSKYFKSVIRLPDELQGLEAEIEAEVRRRLQRGSVFLTVKYSDATAEAAHQINAKALSRYIEQIEQTPQIAKASAGGPGIDLAALLTLPGVLQPPTNEEARLDKARSNLIDLTKAACDGVLDMRAREGTHLQSDLETHRDVIAERLAQIQTRAPDILQDYETRLRNRIDTMIQDAGIRAEPADIIHELAILAERSDVAEEIARLSTHIQQFTEIISEPEIKPVGRTLDFIAQEMLREANTIASKCGDSQVARWTVEVKGAIDRIKEQVQNVE